MLRDGRETGCDAVAITPTSAPPDYRSAMGLRSGVNDWSYRVYARLRHADAWSAPIDEAAGFSAMRWHKYAVLVTFRGDGTAVPTPVWFGLDADDRSYTRTATRTAKVARIRRNPRVQV
jgi:hypothetical protein